MIPGQFPIALVIQASDNPCLFGKGKVQGDFLLIQKAVEGF